MKPSQKTPVKKSDEKPLSPCVEDYLTQYTAEKGSLKPWAEQLVNTFTSEIKEKIRVHWKDSAKTRRMFTNFPVETVWEDEATKTMILNRRNFSLLEPTFLRSLEDYILNIMKNLEETSRDQIRKMVAASYCDEQETQQIEQLLAGTDDVHYSFETHTKTLELLDSWTTQLQCRFPVIEYGRTREQFMLQLIKWEEENKNLVTAKGTSSILRWVPQFRNDVFRVLKESSATATKLVSEAESKLGKEIKFNGTPFSEIFKKQDALISRSKTSFANFKRDSLYFLNESNDKIRDKVLDPSINVFLNQNPVVTLPTPPPMPLHSVEVKFHFDYY